jgi:hypothetical protein
MKYNPKHKPLAFWECEELVNGRWNRSWILSIFQDYYSTCEHSSFALSKALVKANKDHCSLITEYSKDAIIGSFVQSISEEVYCIKETVSNILSLEIFNFTQTSLKKQNKMTDAYIVGDVIFGDFKEILPFIFRNAFPQINHFYCLGKTCLECEKSTLIKTDDVSNKYAYICFKENIIDSFHYLFIQDNENKVNYLLISKNNFEELITRIRAGK